MSCLFIFLDARRWEQPHKNSWKGVKNRKKSWKRYDDVCQKKSCESATTCDLCQKIEKNKNHENYLIKSNAAILKSNNTLNVENSFTDYSRYIYALSFYLTKTVLVGPKWFWSDQIDLDLTIMIWSRPKWNGHDQNELVRSKLWFILVENHNLDLTNPFWS